MVLLTGDGRLRIAAKEESVIVIGTLGILDKLITEKLISSEEYIYCLKEFKKRNGNEIRLPASEIEKRINFIEKTIKML